MTNVIDINNHKEKRKQSDSINEKVQKEFECYTNKIKGNISNFIILTLDENGKLGIRSEINDSYSACTLVTGLELKKMNILDQLTNGMEIKES